MCFGRRRGTCVKRSYRLRPRPPPQPQKPRIDIRRLLPAEQPQSCQLLNLPLEVRQCIYEQALGGRVVYLQSYRRSTFYQPVDHPSINPQKLEGPADSILTVLLLACRQVYLEAQPILLRRNTFYFWVGDLEMIILTRLGRHCLGDIRSVYLYHSYRRSAYVPPWVAVFQLLQQMRLTHLVFEFELDNRIRGTWPMFNQNIDILEGTWVPGVLAIRNLNQFGVFFNHSDGQEISVSRADIAEEMRQLMIGTGADEKYRNFLETRRDSKRRST
jgi:hypothetical protein